MTSTTAILIIAVGVLFVVMVLVSLWRDTRKARRWEEWKHAEQWDRYPRIIDVNVRPLEERDYGDEDKEGRE